MKAEGGRRRANWPHRLAVLTAACTVPLLFIGGLVTTKGAGLAVPDWPTTFGYNPFLYPWSLMVGNIFYEHSHRLAASAVGLLTVLLAAALWLRERRRWLRLLGASALALVIAQGIVGGLRVVLLEQTLAIIHACLAQAFFALAVGLALFTSREWSGESSPPLEAPDAGRFQRLGLITTGLIYVQAVFGAMLRHTGELLEFHLIFAALVSLHVILLGARVFKRHAGRALTRPAFLLSGLLFAQLALGLGAYIGKFVMTLPAALTVAVATSHVVVGALMLAASLVLTLRSFRLFSRRGFTRHASLGSARTMTKEASA